MKRYISIICLILVVSIVSTGCKKEEPEKVKPDEAQIQSICELATLECYYHNVAKGKKEPGTGIKHFGEKERKFWIEYTGVAKIGINMSKVKMTLDGDVVKVTIPQAKLLGLSIDKETLNKDSYIASEDGVNSNPIKAEDQDAAIDNAQSEMEKQVKNNSILLLNARERAKQLIENYIQQMNVAFNTSYKIEWVDSASEDTEETTSDSTQSEE